jgi:hypothetical protein
MDMNTVMYPEISGETIIMHKMDEVREMDMNDKMDMLKRIIPPCYSRIL